MPATGEVKHGFYLGIGIFLALLVLGMGQVAIMKAVRHG